MKEKVVHEDNVPKTPSKYGGSLKELVKERYLHLLIGYFEPGESMKAHVHTVPEEIYYVLSGKGEMVLGDRTIPIEAGMAIYIPPNVVHAPRNTGTEKLVIAFIHSPPETGEYMRVTEK
ncbi:MAG: cupin domain-containing protein [Candidatus Bathyarchaeia archaeon]